VVVDVAAAWEMENVCPATEKAAVLDDPVLAATE